MEYLRKYANGVRRPLHCIIWEKHHKKKLPDYWVVHHKDGNKKNNNISNLEAMPCGDHTRIHYGQNWCKGVWYKTCKICAIEKAVSEFYNATCKSCKKKAYVSQATKNKSKYNIMICPTCGSKVRKI